MKASLGPELILHPRWGWPLGVEPQIKILSVESKEFGIKNQELIWLLCIYYNNSVNAYQYKIKTSAGIKIINRGWELQKLENKWAIREFPNMRIKELRESKVNFEDCKLIHNTVNELRKSLRGAWRIWRESFTHTKYGSLLGKIQRKSLAKLQRFPARSAGRC